jgi:hypothetical protein
MFCLAAKIKRRVISMRSLVVGLFAASLILVFCSAAEAVDESLVLFLPLDEGDGAEVKDLSSYENHGTLEETLGGPAPEWVEGKRGHALNFDGGIIFVPHDDSLTLAGAHTLSFWLKYNQEAGWSPIIAKRPVGFADPDNYSTWVGTDQVWDYRTDNGKVNAETLIELGEWVFLALTHDGQSTVTFYINGVEDVAEDAGPPGFANEDPFVVGSGKGGDGDFGKGMLDEMVLFNRALEPDEIQILMNEGATAVTAGTAVEPVGKLSTTWGYIKNKF